MPAKRNPVERFWEKVNKDGPLPKWAPFLGPCWLWTSFHHPDGYAKLQIGKKAVNAHRFAYELLVGPIPDGLVIDHLCRVRGCVNPDHLEPVTNAENIRRGQTGRHMAIRTRCPQGHEYTEANTYRWGGARICRACQVGQQADQRAKRLGVGLAAGDPRHGTENGYTNWGCRCEPCHQAKLAASRAYRKRKRDSVNTP